MEYICSYCKVVEINTSGGENNIFCVSLNKDHTYARYRVIDLEDVARNSSGVCVRRRELRGLFQNLTSFDHIYAKNRVIDVEHAIEEAHSDRDSNSDSDSSIESYFVASPEDN